MPRGRKPKPVEQKRREGNPGKRPLPEPLKLGGAALAKPADLPPAAAALWDELVGILVTAGVADAVDRPALIALCLQWQRGVDAGRVIQEQGQFSKGSTGQLTEHPAVAIERNAHMLLLRFAEQFGLTAAARARIVSDAAAGRRSAQERERDAILELDDADIVDADEAEL